MDTGGEGRRNLHTNPDSLNAVEIILQKRRWTRDNVEGLLWCPDCTWVNRTDNVTGLETIYAVREPKDDDHNRPACTPQKGCVSE